MARLDPEKRATYEHHTQCRMIAVVGDWNGTDPIVIGAVEESLRDAYVEEGNWESRRQGMLADSGLDDSVDKDTLRDVRIVAWVPYMWAPPEVEAERIEPEGVEAAKALRRHALFGHQEAEPRSLNDVAQELIDAAAPEDRKRVEGECEEFFEALTSERRSWEGS